MKKISAIIYVFTFLLTVACIAWHIQFSPQQKNEKITIVVTTNIISDAVQAIVGDCATVHCLMGPTVDPHTYRARESDVHTLASADVVFYNGLHLEGRMAHVLENMSMFVKTVAVSDALEPHLLRSTEYEDVYDPHIWFDVSLWCMVAAHIQKNLMEYDVKNASYYQQHGDEYLKKLHETDCYVKTKAASLTEKQKILITAHDAFGYFGNRYGFTVVGLQGLSTDSDIGVKDVQLLVDYIIENKVRAIFVESSIPERSLRAVQNGVNARGWRVDIGKELYSDALAQKGHRAQSYCGMLEYTIDTIVNALIE